MSRIHDALEKARREKERAPVAPAVEPAAAPPDLGEIPPPVGDRADGLLAHLAAHFSQECDTMRSAIEAALPDREQRVILFTSSVRGEGCTTVLASLAYSLAARAGIRVCVVDANIKAPGMAALLGCGPQAGLTDVVGRGLDLRMALRATSTPNLHVVLTGNTPLIASEVFGSPRTAAVVEALRRHHAYVLIDAPAVMPVPEVAKQGKDADGVVLVARANRTDRAVVLKARDTLLSAGANVLGVVLNRRRFVIPDFLYRRM